MNGLRAIALVLTILLAGAPALGDQRDVRLDVLFDKLQMIADPADAGALEQEIWRIWYEHEDPAVVLLMRQGHGAMGRRDFRSALRSFNQVVDLVPDFAEGWNARATLFYLMGDYDASLADIEKTLAREPRHFGALSGRGLVYAAMEEWDLALKSFESALAVNPHLDGARRNADSIQKELDERDI